MAIGFLGAYTTFSTFTHEADATLRRGGAATFAAYVGARVALGLVACAIGGAAGRVGYLSTLCDAAGSATA